MHVRDELDDAPAVEVGGAGAVDVPVVCGGGGAGPGGLVQVPGGAEMTGCMIFGGSELSAAMSSMLSAESVSVLSETLIGAKRLPPKDGVAGAGSSWGGPAGATPSRVSDWEIQLESGRRPRRGTPRL